MKKLIVISILFLFSCKITTKKCVILDIKDKQRYLITNIIDYQYDTDCGTIYSTKILNIGDTLTVFQQKSVN